jgi:hypothetical protein
VEIAYFDRGPVFADKLVVAGQWSTYWYNGYLFGSEIARGVDVFRLLPSDQLSKNELDAANLITLDTFNAQEQPMVTWPANFVVAKAYVDQLTRSKALTAAKGADVMRAIERVERATGKAREDAVKALNTLTDELGGTKLTNPIDASRLSALTSTLKAASR